MQLNVVWRCRGMIRTQGCEDVRGASRRRGLAEAVMRNRSLRNRVARRWRRKLFAALGGDEGVRQRQPAVAEAVGEQAVMPDAHEAQRQHVEKEAAQELHRFEGMT